MSENYGSVLSLHRLTALPFDSKDSIFAHYPAMKLGVTEHVAFYADKLANRVLRLMHDFPFWREWVLTAPPYNRIPAAANLLAWQAYQLVSAQLPAANRLSQVDLHVTNSQLRIDSEADFLRYYQYSSNSVGERIREREKQHQGPDDIINHRQDFQGKGVIVINDIKVTGTQQKFMDASFRQVRPLTLNWIYIIEIEEELAESYPQIEHDINHCSIKSSDEFANVLSSTHINYTARCIARLFSQDQEQFKTTLQAVPSEQRHTILELAQKEGRYNSDFFSQKLTALKECCPDFSGIY